MEVGTDGDAAASGCNPGADFGTPVLVAGLASSDTERGGARLTPDELTMYFSARPGGRNAPSGLYAAQRPSLTAPFAAPMPLAALNGSFDDFEPTTLDQLTLYFASSNPAGMGQLDIFVASRPSTAAAFGPPTALAPPINTTANDAQPFLSADGMELWFASTRAHPPLYDIYCAPITGGVVGTPQIVPEISSGTSTDWVPTLSADGLTLFFSSDRGNAFQNVHIWTGSRARLADPFSNLHLVAALNSASAQWDIAGWLSTDGCRFYMSSTRPPAAADGMPLERIYVATRGN
jgi:hypothetical protein